MGEGSEEQQSNSVIEKERTASTDAVEVVSKSYVEYSKYVAKTRAFPSMLDGMKTVYRRMIYGSRSYTELAKSSAILGETAKIHPHGIDYGVLVTMTSEYGKFPLYHGKGNFGGLGFCFTGDTKISLLDGRELSLEKVHKEVQEGKNLWVYSATESGKILPKKITNSFDQGERVVVEVLLDNNEVIRCTPDHRFMLRDGDYKMAKDLEPTDSLMPLYRRVDSRGYEEVYDNESYQWMKTHRLELDNVPNYNELYGEGRRVVHHVDFDKTNNNPDNLVGMTWRDHTKYHAEHCSKLLHTPEVQARATEGLRNYFSNLTEEELKETTSHMNTPEVQKRARRNHQRTLDNMSPEEKAEKYLGNSQVLRDYWDSLTDQEKKEFLNNSMNRPGVKRISFADMDPDYHREVSRKGGKAFWDGDPDHVKVSREKAVSTILKNNPNHYRDMLNAGGGWEPNRLQRGKLRKAYGEVLDNYGEVNRDTWNKLKSESSRLILNYERIEDYYGSVDNLHEDYMSRVNHKVVSVRYLDQSEKVYDIEVEELNNFSLSAGVVVHNSAAAQRYTEAYLNEIARLLYLDLIEYAEYEEGDSGFMEPKYLPSLLPYAYLAGTQGMSVGMPTTNVPSLNVMQLIDYYVDTINGVPLEDRVVPLPDFDGALLDGDKELYRETVLSGFGRMWFKPVVNNEAEGVYVVTKVPEFTDIDRLLRRLSYYIDNDIVYYTDETDNKIRYVFETVDFNKLSPEDLEAEIDSALSCSRSFSSYFEHEGKVYSSGLVQVVDAGLKYLRECVVRKYEDKLTKLENRSLVLLAIKDLKESGELGNITSKTTKYYKDLLVTMGHEPEVASSALGRSISYLTKSHDNEFEKIKEDRESYETYLNNPDKYLLESYDKLRDMIKDFYDSRPHSMFIDDQGNLDSNIKVTMNSEKTKLLFKDDEDADGLEWNYQMVSVTDRGKFNCKNVSIANTTEIELDPIEGEKYVGLMSDKTEYYIVAISGGHISVIPRDRVSLGINQYFNLRDNQEVVGCYSTDKPLVKITSDTGEWIKIVPEEWTKTRVALPYHAIDGEIIDMDGRLQ